PSAPLLPSGSTSSWREDITARSAVLLRVCRVARHISARPHILDAQQAGVANPLAAVGGIGLDRVMGRWRFADEMTAAEREARHRTMARIDAWWDEFRARTGDLDAVFGKQKEWDLPEWMARHLQAVDPDLMWEYGPAVRGDGHRLVITPE